MGKKGRRGVLRLEKGQRMFADPRKYQFGCPTHFRSSSSWNRNKSRHIRPANQLVKNDSVVNAFDPCSLTVVIVKELPPRLLIFVRTSRAHSSKSGYSREINSGFLFFRLNFKQNNILRIRISNNDSA